MTRDELLWRMAESAWGYYYCINGARGNFCEQCNKSRSSSGEVGCFELSDGFKRGPDNMEWKWAAEGALVALEKALGIKCGFDEPDAELEASWNRGIAKIDRALGATPKTKR